MQKIVSLILLSVTISLSSTAQDSTLTRDLESWIAVGGQKKFLDNKLTVGLQQQFRLDNNTSRLSQFFTTLEADYEVYKNLKLGAGYRFIKDRNGKNGYVTEHRFNLDASYSKKFDRLRAGARIRYQRRSNALYTQFPTTKYRLRLKLNYNIPNWKFDPFFSTEFFYAKENLSYGYVDDVTEENPITGLQKYRLQIGTSRKTGKLGEVKVFYMLEHQFSDYGTNFGVPINWNVFGINYTFKL